MIKEDNCYNFLYLIIALGIIGILTLQTSNIFALGLTNIKTINYNNVISSPETMKISDLSNLINMPNSFEYSHTILFPMILTPNTTYQTCLFKQTGIAGCKYNVQHIQSAIISSNNTSQPDLRERASNFDTEDESNKPMFNDELDNLNDQFQSPTSDPSLHQEIKIVNKLEDNPEGLQPVDDSHLPIWRILSS